MRALIIGSGEGVNLSDAADAELIICADGGYDHAKKNGIIPNVILGDMDSVSSNVEKENIVVYPTEKDFCDSEIAIDYALSKGADDIIMTGVTGSRLDHTLSNIHLMKRIADKGAVPCIKDEHNTLYYLCSNLRLFGMKGKTVSIIPMSERLLGVTLSGFYYPLSNEDLYFCESRGISNVITEDTASVSVLGGYGIVIVNDGH